MRSPSRVTGLSEPHQEQISSRVKTQMTIQSYVCWLEYLYGFKKLSLWTGTLLDQELETASHWRWTASSQQWDFRRPYLRLGWRCDVSGVDVFEKFSLFLASFSPTLLSSLFLGHRVCGGSRGPQGLSNIYLSEFILLSLSGWMRTNVTPLYHSRW